MTRPKRNDETINVTKQELLRLLKEEDALKKLMQTLLQEVLEAEMEDALRAGKGERTAGRLGGEKREKLHQKKVGGCMRGDCPRRSHSINLVVKTS